ncbi:hypothetical protein D3C86_1049500 [compost metagenome]
MGFQREMAGVQQFHDGIRIVAPKGLRSGRNENGIILPPDRQRRQPGAAEERLELRIQRQIVGIVQEQVQLDVLVARTLKQGRVQRVALRRHAVRVGDALHILPLRALQVQHAVVNRLPVHRRGIRPVRADRRPRVSQPFEIGIAVLRHQTGDTVGMGQGQAQARRRAVVKEVQRVAGQSKPVDERFQRLGQVVERIAVAAFSRHLREAETGQIGSNHAEMTGQPGNQVAELMRRAGKAMQQQQHWRLRISSLAVEETQPVGMRVAIVDDGVGLGGHGDLRCAGLR